MVGVGAGATTAVSSFSSPGQINPEGSSSLTTIETMDFSAVPPDATLLPSVEVRCC